MAAYVNNIIRTCSGNNSSSNAAALFILKLIIILSAVLLFRLSVVVGIHPNQGSWKQLKRNMGISAMHMVLLPNDRIIAFDRTGFGPSNITLPNGKCHKNGNCYAYSVEFDPATRNVRPLTVLTDTWCSSGGLSPDGQLVQSGGYKNGDRVVRFFKPCLNCDWVEDLNGLLSPRWYASNQVLPNGKMVVVGGASQFSYEFIPKTIQNDYKEFQFPFLIETKYTDHVPNNLYPFIHLSPDGNLFVFANDRAVLLDYSNHKVVRRYPAIPASSGSPISRNYPSTGSSVLLPLNLNIGQYASVIHAEVLICGGTHSDANFKASIGDFVEATKTCGRLTITGDVDPKWVMMEMPLNRIMGDMILLPTGDVLIINGASKGSAGWGFARDPVLNPVLYNPNINKFDVLNASPTPRLYHSSAHLLSDGRVLVAGSNPNSNYNFTTLYPTELSVEAFYPPYLCGNKPRPSINGVFPGLEVGYKQKLSIDFKLSAAAVTNTKSIDVTLVAPSFTSHSFSMNQRVLVLELAGVRQMSTGNYVVDGFAPATAALAPPGYYQLFVVSDGVPSRAKWVRIK